MLSKGGKRAIQQVSAFRDLDNVIIMTMTFWSKHNKFAFDCTLEAHGIQLDLGQLKKPENKTRKMGW